MVRAGSGRLLIRLWLGGTVMTAQPHVTTLQERKSHDVGQLFLLEVDGQWIVVGEAANDEAARRSPVDWSARAPLC